MNLDTGNTNLTNKRNTSEYEETVMMEPIDRERNRYPYCIVWTPIPVLT